MQLKQIIKEYKGKFLHLYNLVYKLDNGKEKIYEMISRNSNMKSGKEISDDKCRGVVILGLTVENGITKLLINKEFRMACNAYVYNLPAGLIEDGESIEEAAKRELFEETGMELTKVLGITKPYYTADGYTNEKSVMIFCDIKGTLTNKNETPDEDITPMLITLEEAEDILKQDKILCGTKTQMVLYSWLFIEKY